MEDNGMLAKITGDVVAAIREQNVQVAAGVVASRPPPAASTSSTR